MRFTWSYCQEHSDDILFEGIIALRNSERQSLNSEFPEIVGNYLIADETGSLFYIGEAINLSNRLSQHARKSSSTFFKNYKKIHTELPESQQRFELLDFSVSYISTRLGRKEIEEFGIVNLPAQLNRFQLNKRDIYSREAGRLLRLLLGGLKAGLGPEELVPMTGMYFLPMRKLPGNVGKSYMRHPAGG